METEKSPAPGSGIEVRFGLAYSILILIISVILALIAYIAKGDDKVIKYLLYGMSLLVFLQGVYAISGGKIIKFDPKAKKIKFCSIFGMVDRNIRYDKLVFEGNDLFREVDGKRKYVNLQRYQCNREDIKKFMDAVRQQP